MRLFVFFFCIYEVDLDQKSLKLFYLYLKNLSMNVTISYSSIFTKLIFGRFSGFWLMQDSPQCSNSQFLSKNQIGENTTREMVTYLDSLRYKVQIKQFQGFIFDFWTKIDFCNIV